MKYYFMGFFGTIGAVIAYAFGGWDSAIILLLSLMGIDWLTGGIVIPFIFKKSPKTENGLASSEIGFIGLMKKSFILFFVIIANQLDIVLGMDIVRTGVIFAFSANELLSIIENAGIMKIPIPTFLIDCVELLKKKSPTEG